MVLSGIVPTNVTPTNRSNPTRVIDFSNNNHADLNFHETGIFKCFVDRSYRNIKGGGFSIKLIRGPFGVYDTRAINYDNIDSLTLYYPKGNPTPFVMLIQTTDRQHGYYCLDLNDTLKWIEYKGLEDSDHLLANDKLAVVLKDRFCQFFKTELHINRTFFNRNNYLNECYSIYKNNFYDDYDMYDVDQQKLKSICAVYFDGLKIEFDKEIKFVKKFTFYFWKGDASIILFIQTKDIDVYHNGIYNYYQRKSSLNNQWNCIVNGKDLSREMEKETLRKVLDKIVDEYINLPIKIYMSKKENMVGVMGMTRRLNSAHNDFLYNGSVYYSEYVYIPRVGKCFTLEGIYIEGQLQEINLPKKQCSYLKAYSRNQEGEKPVLMCVGYPNTGTGSQNCEWYEVEQIGRHKWVKSKLITSPEKDQVIIGNRIEIMYKHFRDEQDKGEKFKVIVLCIIGIILLGSILLLVKHITKNGETFFRGLRGWSRFT